MRKRCHLCNCVATADNWTVTCMSGKTICERCCIQSTKQEETPMSTTRKQFEQYYSGQFPWLAFKLDSWSEVAGRYGYNNVQVRWETWQACCANEVVQQSIKAQQVGEVQEPVRTVNADEAPFGLTTAEKVAWARGANDAIKEYGTTPAQGAPTGVMYREALHGAAKEARVPVHILKAADDVTRYMDTYHPGNWEIAGCARRKAHPPKDAVEQALDALDDDCMLQAQERSGRGTCVSWRNYTREQRVRAMGAALAAAQNWDRAAPTPRREEAVKKLLSLGWAWDGSQWRGPKAVEVPMDWRDF